MVAANYLTALWTLSFWHVFCIYQNIKYSCVFCIISLPLS